MDDVSPAPIIASILGYFRTAAMLAATRLDLFTRIAEGVGNVPALAAACGAEERSIRALCDFLVVDRHLEGDRNGYRLTQSSALFLDKRSPAYMGSIADFLASAANRSQALDDPVGFMLKQLRESAGNVEPENPVWVAYARAMTPLSLPVAKSAAAALAPRCRDARRILDIAAGSGVFGIELLRLLPEARVTAIDWPAVLAEAGANAGRRKVAERWSPLPGNAFEVEFGGGYDLVLLPNFLHHFDRSTNVALLRKVHAALAKDGHVAIIEFVPNEDRVSPPDGALFAMRMLGTTPAGDAYTLAEYRQMLTEAGFARVEDYSLAPAPQQLIVAHADPGATAGRGM